MPFTRKYGWGEALYLETSLHSPGLKWAADQIAEVVGSAFGTRNTFAKLFELAEPPEPGTKEHVRAWLLLTVIGQDPVAWRVGKVDLPAAFDSEKVADLLIRASACTFALAC